MTDQTPRTKAGRRIFDEKPIGWTGQDWRAAVLAVESEAMSLETKAWLAEGYHRSEREAVAPPEPPRMALAFVEGCLDRALAIIEVADGRAAAADGPVGHVRDEMTDTEWRELYVALQEARAAALAHGGTPA